MSLGATAIPSPAGERRALRTAKASSTARTTPSRTPATAGHFLFSTAAPRMDHHDQEDEQNHDGPGIDDDLDDGHERRAEEAEKAAERGERQDEPERGIGGIFRQDHGKDGTEATGREDEKDHGQHFRLTHYIFCPIARQGQHFEFDKMVFSAILAGRLRGRAAW
jgi:hypothetical protein